MRLITRNTDYAIRAICFMAKSDKKTISVTELVKELKMPRPFLRKILQALNGKGLLRSHKGRGGGFVLAVRPGKIFLLDLIEALQGPLNLNECFFKKTACPNRSYCTLKGKMDKIEDHVMTELKLITLESLIK